VRLTSESRDNLIAWWTRHCPDDSWYDVIEALLRHIENGRWDRIFWESLQSPSVDRRLVHTPVQGLFAIVEVHRDGIDEPWAHLVNVFFELEINAVENEWDLP
jgi:hypothetical protein